MRKGIDTDIMTLLRYIIIAILATVILLALVGVASAQTEKACQTFTGKVWYYIKSLFSVGPLKVWTPENVGC
ncbi:MAG: hypothetical protein WA139_04025 [Candidatus Aenigmatarchaeota archaeon]